MLIDVHPAPDASDSSPDISDSIPDVSNPPSTSSIPLNTLMTRREVAQLLRITEHCLSFNRAKWNKVLPRIEMEGSNIIRYRRSDVMRLIEQGCTPVSDEKKEGVPHDRV